MTKLRAIRFVTSSVETLRKLRIHELFAGAVYWTGEEFTAFLMSLTVSGLDLISGQCSPHACACHRAPLSERQRTLVPP